MSYLPWGPLRDVVAADTVPFAFFWKAAYSVISLAVVLQIGSNECCMHVRRCCSQLCVHVSMTVGWMREINWYSERQSYSHPNHNEAQRTRHKGGILLLEHTSWVIVTTIKRTERITCRKNTTVQNTETISSRRKKQQYMLQCYLHLHCNIYCCFFPPRTYSFCLNNTVTYIVVISSSNL